MIGRADCYLRGNGEAAGPKLCTLSLFQNNDTNEGGSHRGKSLEDKAPSRSAQNAFDLKTRHQSKT